MSLNFIDGLIAGMLLGLALEQVGFIVARYLRNRLDAEWQKGYNIGTLDAVQQISRGGEKDA